MVLESMLTCARTKIVFGGLTAHDLDILAREVLFSEFDPYIIKDQRTTLELDPIESKRVSVTSGSSHSQSETHSAGGSRSKSAGESHSQSRQHGSGSTNSHTVGHSNGHVLSSSSGSSEGSSNSEMTMELPDGTIAPISTSAGDSGSQSESATTTDITTESESNTCGSSQFESHGEQHGLQTNETSGQSWSTATGESTGENHSKTIAPFYSYNKRRVVSHRAFFSVEEFWTLAIQQLKGQPKMTFCISVPDKKPLFLRAPFVKIPWISARQRARGMAVIFSRPYYHSTIPQAPASRPNPIEMLESNRTPQLHIASSSEAKSQHQHEDDPPIGRA